MSDHQQESEVFQEEKGGDTLSLVTVESLQVELTEMKDQWLRAVAESENSRRRAMKEKEDAQKFSISHFAREVLTIADNLRRALDHSHESSDLPPSIKAFVEGVEMTEKELLGIFDRQGIKKIDPLHQKFDPHFHQAMFEVEMQDHEPGIITQVLQCGYILHDRLLRPALVGVSKVSLKGEEKVDTTV